MRSRPDIKVYLDPASPTPGSELLARVVLLSRSETPIEGIDVRLLAQERRFRGTAMVGNVPVPQYDTAVHTDLTAHLPECVLVPGKHQHEVSFDLPAGAPPAYQSKLTRIEYELLVHVSIPWWPDRTARFVVPVVAAPTAKLGKPGLFCTDERGPRGTDLYLEASLDRDAVPVGGVLHGAVSVANVAQHRVRRVELSLVAHEHRLGTDAVGDEVERHTYQLAGEAPAEGQPMRFRVTLPAEAQPSLSASFIEVLWSVEVRAVVALGTDVTLLVPITVFVPAAHAATDARPAAHVPPVGRERRARIWAESARKRGLRSDPEEERMTLEVPGASLAVTLEPRKTGGLALVATVAWPPLGINLAVAELRWVDAWSRGRVEIPSPLFAERFTVRGRDPAQILAFLDDGLCDRLLRFDEAAVGDEGATLLSAGAAQSAKELDAFLARAVAAARALGAAAQRVPPPAIMAAHVHAWRAFATALGGRLVTGDMSIHDATHDDAPLRIATEWSKGGAPAATLVRFPLAERTGPDAARPRHLDGTAQALVDSLSAQVTALAVGEHAIEARVPAPIADPATLEPIVAGLSQLARRLAGGAARGPYR